MTDLIVSRPTAAAQLRGYMEALLLVAASTLVGLIMVPRWGPSAVDLLFLPAVLAAAILGGRGPALLAALGSALAYNFFFTAPHLTLEIDNPNDIVTVLVLFATALVTSQLAASVRRQARIAQTNAVRNAAIAGVAGRLLTCTSEQEVMHVTARELAEIFSCNAVLVGKSPGKPILFSSADKTQLAPSDLAAAALVFETGERAGRGVSRAVPTEWQFHPIRSGAAVIAALGLARNDGAPPVLGEQLPLLDNLLDQAALALERSRLESEARHFAEERERDRTRSALLASIGQDLRPRLAAITKAVNALRRRGNAEKDVVASLASEASRMDRYLSNLADLEPGSGSTPLHVGELTIDLVHRVILRGDAPVHLTPKEYAVLAELAKHPNRVLTHGHLLKTVWGPAQARQADYLRVAIRALRQKLEADPAAPKLILNEPAVGYRLKTA